MRKLLFCIFVVILLPTLTSASVIYNEWSIIYTNKVGVSKKEGKAIAYEQSNLPLAACRSLLDKNLPTVKKGMLDEFSGGDLDPEYVKFIQIARDHWENGKKFIDPKNPNSSFFLHIYCAEK